MVICKCWDCIHNINGNNTCDIEKSISIGEHGGCEMMVVGNAERSWDLYDTD